MSLIDSHCHLQFDKLKNDLGGVLSRAETAGVTKMICVGTSLKDSLESAEFARQNDRVWAAVGVHPHEAGGFNHAALADLLQLPKVVAAGEIGLDYYKQHSPKELQFKSLKAQIETALPSGLPFIFHVRDAWSDFWEIFDSYGGLKGVIHSFSSGAKQLDAAVSRGLYIGLNGIMTFTKDQAQLEAAKVVPLSRLILETDAPFLTPAPNRSETCEPRHVAVTAEFLAQLRGENIKELAEATTANANRLFKLT